MGKKGEEGGGKRPRRRDGKVNAKEKNARCQKVKYLMGRLFYEGSGQQSEEKGNSILRKIKDREGARKKGKSPFTKG